jgi:cell division protein FtsI/penicillin-binding protein 2
MKGYGHKRRLIIIAGLLGVAFAGLSARLVMLQVCDHDRYRAVAERKQVFLREPRRGEILDANGNPLAISVPVKKIFANPKFIGSQYSEVARALAPFIGMNEGELARKLHPTILRTNEFGMPITNSYVNLRKKVTLEQWQQITQVMNGLTFAAETGSLTKSQKRYYRTLRQKGIYAEDDQLRTYPGGRLASHVLGYVQDDELDFNEGHLIEMTGKYGIERWFNNQLRGVRGWRISETDHKRREIVVYRQQEIEARPGLNVVLTLDIVVQNILESALEDAVQKHSPKSVSAMAVRPATGEILGLAVWPDFDPADPGNATPDHMRNRIVADSYEPGSVFKIVAIAAALNENLVRLTDMINCENGLWHYAGKPLKDHGHYSVIPFEMVVAKSSNIGTAKVGLMLGEERLI